MLQKRKPALPLTLPVVRRATNSTVKQCGSPIARSGKADFGRLVSRACRARRRQVIAKRPLHMLSAKIALLSASPPVTSHQRR